MRIGDLVDVGIDTTGALLSASRILHRLQ
jgi:hypothetical protein